MTALEKNFRTRIGFGAAVLAAIFVLWLPLGIIDLVPFTFAIPGESEVRTHAGLAVGSLMIAAWDSWGQ